LDLDYLTFAILLGVFGVVGVTATANVTPNILASATCNCIPSPVARFQELSLVLLAASAVLAPVGVLRRNSAANILSPHETLASGNVYTGEPMRSGELFALGVSLIVLGVGVVATAFLVLSSLVLMVEGAAMVAFGVLLGFRGGRAK
jgi:hypothetical protein